MRELPVEAEFVYSRHAAAEMSVAYGILVPQRGQDRRPGGGRRKR